MKYVKSMAWIAGILSIQLSWAAPATPFITDNVRGHDTAKVDGVPCGTGERCSSDTKPDIIITSDDANHSVPGNACHATITGSSVSFTTENCPPPDPTFR